MRPFSTKFDCDQFMTANIKIEDLMLRVQSICTSEVFAVASNIYRRPTYYLPVTETLL